MFLLFRSGTVREKASLILKATKTHAQNLAKYATVYKLTMLALKHMGSDPGKEGPYDTFFAGLLGGYLVFGRRNKRGHVSSVSKQIVIFGRFPCPFLLPSLSLRSSFKTLDKADFRVKWSIRKSLPLPGTTLHPTLIRDYQEPRALETNSTRCVAGLRSYELGERDVAIQVVP